MMGISMGLMSAWISLSVPSAMALYWTCSSLFAPAQSWVVNKYYNAAILNAKSEAQRLAKIRLEEEAVVSETYSKKGIKKFAPIYAIPQAAEAEQTSSEEVTEEVSEPTKTAAKKSASSKKKKGGSKGNQSSSAYQGKKKK